MHELIQSKFLGNQAEFARAIHRSPNLVWQYLHGYREIGERFARHVEGSLRLPNGWMDRDVTEAQDHAVHEDRMPYLDSSRIGAKAWQAVTSIAIAIDDGHLTDADIKLLQQIIDQLAQKP